MSVPRDRGVPPEFVCPPMVVLYTSTIAANQPCQHEVVVARMVRTSSATWQQISQKQLQS